MADDAAISRLLQRISQWCGLDVAQRAGEVVRWLDAHGATGLGGLAPLTRTELAEKLLCLAQPLAQDLVRSLTISHTRFFRDSEQLGVVDSLLVTSRQPKLRIWVAGCATGEEAYTVALLALARRREVELIASDINADSLAQARAGRYPVEVLQRIPEPQRAEFIRDGAFVQASPRLRGAVRFVEHNLVERPLRPPDAPEWDMILCRNVLIHFYADQAAATLERLAAVLAPGGFLILGASEFQHRPQALVPAHIAEHMVLQRPQPERPETVFKAAATGPVVAPPPPPPAAAPPQRQSADDIPSAKHLAGLLSSGALDRVLQATLPVLMVDPEQQPALLLAGIAYHLKGRHREAAALLERTQAQHPSCWPASHFLTLSLDHLGQADAACRAAVLMQSAATPTPAAQALIDLIDFGPWRKEAMGLARARLAGLQDKPLSTVEYRFNKKQ